MMEFFFEKKRFHLFKSFLYKNGKAENMPVVAGPIVDNSTEVGKDEHETESFHFQAFTFTQIERGEYNKLFDFVKQKNIPIKNIGEEEGRDSDSDLLGSDESDDNAGGGGRYKLMNQSTATANEKLMFWVLSEKLLLCTKITR